MRMNMVGTHWLWVTLYVSMARSASTGSNFSMITTVPPRRWTGVTNARGAAWYMGAGDR